jgi:hypothetical protein
MQNGVMHQSPPVFEATHSRTYRVEAYFPCHLENGLMLLQ